MSRPNPNPIFFISSWWLLPRPATGWGFFMPGANPMEKAIETITLHLPESLKRDLQDLALADDRAVGEWIRHHLTMIVYGRLAAKEAAKRTEEKRK
jgi:hypothetical protein